MPVEKGRVTDFLFHATRTSKVDILPEKTLLWQYVVGLHDLDQVKLR